MDILDDMRVSKLSAKVGVAIVCCNNPLIHSEDAKHFWFYLPKKQVCLDIINKSVAVHHNCNS